MKHVTLAIIILSTALFGSMPVGATTVKDLQKKQEQAKADVNSAKKSLKEVLAEKNGVLSEIEQFDIELQAVSDEYLEVSEDLEMTIEFLAKTEEELAAAEKQREEQFEAYKSRLRYLHENGNLGYLEILFKSATFADFLNSVEYINKIVEYDNEIADQLLATENLIAEKVASIELKKTEVSVLAKQLEAKQLALENMKDEKNAMLERLNADEQKYTKEINDLEAASKSIEKLIQEAQAKERAENLKKASVATFSGTMRWPVPSSIRVTSQYGWRTSPKKEFHSGVDIGAAYGADITAAAKGTVILSQYYGGYGYCVIIEHGGGLSTLYGHASKLVAKVGDKIEQGQVIAKIGSTGYSTGNHLHFEVRKNGSHVTPKGYLNY